MILPILGQGMGCTSVLQTRRLVQHNWLRPVASKRAMEDCSSHLCAKERESPASMQFRKQRRLFEKCLPVQRNVAEKRILLSATFSFSTCREYETARRMQKPTKRQKAHAFGLFRTLHGAWPCKHLVVLPAIATSTTSLPHPLPYLFVISLLFPLYSRFILIAAGWSVSLSHPWRQSILTRMKAQMKQVQA